MIQPAIDPASLLVQGVKEGTPEREITLREFVTYGAHSIDFVRGASEQSAVYRALGHFSLSDPVPLVLPKHGHKQVADGYREELARVEAMTSEEVLGMADASFVAVTSTRDSLISTGKSRVLKYNAMLTKVESWTPPTEQHQGLKDFLVQNLLEAVSSCDVAFYERTKPFHQTGEGWRQAEIKRLQGLVEHHDREYAAELKRVEEQNAWLTLLHESLP